MRGILDIFSSCSWAFGILRKDGTIVASDLIRYTTRTPRGPYIDRHSDGQRSVGTSWWDIISHTECCVVESIWNRCNFARKRKGFVSRFFFFIFFSTSLLAYFQIGFVIDIFASTMITMSKTCYFLSKPVTLSMHKSLKWALISYQSFAACKYVKFSAR